MGGGSCGGSRGLGFCSVFFWGFLSGARGSCAHWRRPEGPDPGKGRIETVKAPLLCEKAFGSLWSSQVRKGKETVSRLFRAPRRSAA